MPTIEERLAALEAKLAALTATTPTEYYTHQYSGEEIDAAVGRAVAGGTLDTSVTNVSNQLGTFVRPNLLDNWYFGNPINQRGQTSYTDVGYGIDRWFMYSGALKIQNGIIELSGSSSGGTLEQKIENPKRFAGKTVTLSVLGKRSKSSWYISVRQDGVYRNINLSITNSFACASVTFVADSTLSNDLSIVFACWDESDVAEIKAVKLELGPTQTLAHREGDRWVLNEVPDYGEQLRRCQRYSNVLPGIYWLPQNADGTNRLTIPIPDMRTVPAVTYEPADGSTGTLYYDANLAQKNSIQFYAIGVTGICGVKNIRISADL